MMDEYEDDELDALNAQLEAAVRENEKLIRENELFTAYLQRHALEVKDVQVEETVTKGRYKGKSRKPKIPTVLTIDQQFEIGTSELDEVNKEIEETKKTSGRLIDTLTAVLEETDVRIAELKKEAYEFKRDIVVGAENFRTGKTMAEKVIRYMEEKLRQKDAMIEKLRLKNATLKTHIKKVEIQLKHKEEMGDVLHYIDFHQLQIENKQYIAKIDERNTELLQLKMTTGKTVQVLNNLKKKLNALIHESEWLKQEIQQRTELLSKLRNDNTSVAARITKEEKQQEKLKAQVEDNSDMPQVMDYVSQKAQMFELKKEVASWQRKVEIASLGRRGGGRTGSSTMA